MARTQIPSSRHRVRCIPVVVAVLFFVVSLFTGIVSAGPVISESPGLSPLYIAGEEITLSGETNLAPGTVLQITVEEAAFRPAGKEEDSAYSGTSGTVAVQEGSPAFWTFSFVTGGWTPGEYLVVIEIPKTGTTESGTFTLLSPEEAEETVLPSSLPSSSPTVTASVSPFPSSAPSPTSAPISSLIWMAGFVIVCLLRAYSS